MDTLTPERYRRYPPTVGETTFEQFRTEFASDSGRRRLGCREGDPWAGRVERLLADDGELRDEYDTWRRRQHRRSIAASKQAKNDRRRTGATIGLLLIVGGLLFWIAGANAAADHQQRIRDGLCYERPHLYSEQTTTVCPAHMEPLYDGYRAAVETAGWIGFATLVVGSVLVVRHPQF